MSVPFHRVLVNPDEASLLRTLEEASRAAGYASDARGGFRRWRPVLDEVAAYAEGRSQLQHRMAGSSTPYLVVAWWSDHRRDKHVGVFSGSDAGGPQLHYSRLDHDPRPPLWHLYPERLFLVRRPGRPAEWRAACACGAVGRPEELGWMGPCCGPCHDRALEGEPVRGAHRPGVLIPTGGGIVSLAFSPSRPTLAVSSEGRALNLIDLDGSKTPLRDGSGDGEHQEFRPMGFSPNGQFLVVADPHGPVLRVWQEGMPEEEHRVDLFDAPMGLAFSPDSSSMAVCLEDMSVYLFFREEGFWHEEGYLEFGASSLCFSPDGRALARGCLGGVVKIWGLFSSTETLEIDTGTGDDQEVVFLHYVRGGTALLLLTGPEDGMDLPVIPVSEPGRNQNGGHLRLWDLKHNREERRADVPLPSSLALTPDGRALAMVVHDERRSPAEVVFWDVEAWQEAGRLEWNPDADVRCLAFSPDGQTLAMGAGDGSVVLAPWRLLLEG
jgi:WD40 repeat protein